MGSTLATALLGGTFHPSREEAGLIRAPHGSRPAAPVTFRDSDPTGVPTVADNDPKRSSPRGINVRFHLAYRVHTDVVAPSTNGFPVRTSEEFLEVLRAAAAAGAGKHLNRRTESKHTKARGNHVKPRRI